MRRLGVYSGLAAVMMLVINCVSSDVSRTMGARCDSDRECDDRCLSGDDFPGGFCSTGCRSDDDCPANARCASGEGSVCLIACSKDSECEFLGSNWRCRSAGSSSGRVCRGG
jgi:hypothetical protein